MMRLREKSSQSRAIYSLVLRNEKNRRFVSYNKNKEIK